MMDFFFIWLLSFFIVFIGMYLFAAFCMYRLGRKFGVGSFGEYCIPIYNLYLLNKCARLETPFLLINLIPFIGAIIWATIAYGRIAERLGKNYWLYGLGSILLLGIPFYIMAFDRSMPIDGRVMFSQGSSFGNQISIEKSKEPIKSPQDNRFFGSKAFLYGKRGMYVDSVIPIPQEGIVIGRDPGMANVVIDHSNVSQAHIRVTHHPSKLHYIIIEDLGSTNGTYYSESLVNDQWIPLIGSKEFLLTSAIKIRIGQSDEIFEIILGDS